VSGLHDQPDDATPLTAEEREGLIPTNISLRRELNEVEQQNIYEATSWALLQARGDPLDENFARRLHARMFGKVWRWAGTYRSSDKNIGVSRWEIQIALVRVIGNVRYWIENQTYPPDEIAARFHHGIVLVHPFPNGQWPVVASDDGHSSAKAWTKTLHLGQQRASRRRPDPRRLYRRSQGSRPARLCATLGLCANLIYAAPRV